MRELNTYNNNPVRQAETLTKAKMAFKDCELTLKEYSRIVTQFIKNMEKLGR
jgi:hypothetical protein